MTEEPQLHGKRVLLRPTTEPDRLALLAIRQTAEVLKRWPSDDLDWDFANTLADPDTHQFTITTRTSSSGTGGAKTIVGMVQFSEENDPEYRHASIDIYIDPAAHRQGFGSDSIETLATYIFDVLGHHRITIDPVAGNLAAIACYTKAGFKPVGVMREYELQTDGTWADGLLMDLLASDR